MLADRSAVGADASTLAATDDKLARYFEGGSRDLSLRDIKQADASDVRMGTFTLCAAFVDAMALTYSAGLKIARNDAGKWSVFMETFFGEAYRALWNSYSDFRCLLLHNFAPSHRLGFTHGPERARLHLQERDGRLLPHRESFVADVERAFDAFYAEVRTDADLQARALAHLDRYSSSGRSAECHTRLDRLGAVSGRQMLPARLLRAAPALRARTNRSSPAQDRPTPSAAP